LKAISGRRRKKNPGAKNQRTGHSEARVTIEFNSVNHKSSFGKGQLKSVEAVRERGNGT
jgi:anti-anti-sigma regulatory factor